MDFEKFEEPITAPIRPTPEQLESGLPLNDPPVRNVITLIVLVSVITVLTGAVTFTVVLGKGQSGGMAVVAMLPLIGLSVNQLIIAIRSETARHEIKSEVTKTRHDIKGDLNYTSLLAQAKDRADFQALIRTIAEEIRSAEREQFWTDPSNRNQLRSIFKEVTEECREESRAMIVKAIEDYHKLHHAHDEPSSDSNDQPSQKHRSGE